MLTNIRRCIALDVTAPECTFYHTHAQVTRHNKNCARIQRHALKVFLQSALVHSALCIKTRQLLVSAVTAP